MNKLSLIPIFLLLAFSAIQAQVEYRVGLIGFYNFENLFDTLDTPDVRDTEFTPDGDKLYGTKIYQEKLSHLSKVVSEMGKDMSPDGLALVGVCEIENRSVLEDFVKQDAVKDRNYQIVHQDSPDKRGIDVALLYNPKYFEVTDYEAIPVVIYRKDNSRIYTRDILHVSGLFDGDPIHVFVNHWPSRSGGEAASAPRRNACALIVKEKADSLKAINPRAKIIVMGDLNDDPTSDSVAKVLNAKGKTKQVRRGGFFNPMYDFYKKGIGTTAWRDAWSLFDQLIVSEGLLNRELEGYRFYSANVYNPKYLFQRTGHFKGYPFRTFSGDTYLGGYSDHFPVYLVLVKPI